VEAVQNIIKYIVSVFALIISLLNPGSKGSITPIKTPETLSDKLRIETLRSGSYPGSEITIEETLSREPGYKRYITSYLSEGLKIYALLLLPTGERPKNGWPVIILNHGYIIPERYTPDGNYIPYADAFAKNGYIVFKPNYRGNGQSEGSPTSTYFSPDYIVDNLNAISSIKKYPLADPAKIGVWGHSMGGNITLKDVVINRKDIKAAVIWGGVVAPINDIIYNWQGRVSYKPDREDLMLRNLNLQELLKVNGTPASNPDFWNSIDPTFYLKDITAPIQIQVGLSDNQVPPDFSRGLYEKLKSIGKSAQYFEYPGSNHDINQDFTKAMQRTIDFFDRYLR
jgi:uncharacterized protein